MQIIPDRTYLARRAWDDLTAEEKRETIFGLADEGFGDYQIAQATRLSVEMVRQIIAERNASE